MDQTADLVRDVLRAVASRPLPAQSEQLIGAVAHLLDDTSPSAREETGLPSSAAMSVHVMLSASFDIDRAAILTCHLFCLLGRQDELGFIAQRWNYQDDDADRIRASVREMQALRSQSAFHRWWSGLRQRSSREKTRSTQSDDSL